MRNPGKQEKWAARGERLAAALRENLKRRKAQVRGRAAAAAEGEGTKTGETADAKAPDFRRNPGNE